MPKTGVRSGAPCNKKGSAKSASPSITKAPNCCPGIDAMQCVILAGGLGTRMRPLTETCPKTLLPVNGRPFAYHQLHWLAAQGVTEAIYCIGHEGHRIRRYWDAEPSPIPSIRYVDEGA